MSAFYTTLWRWAYIFALITFLGVTGWAIARPNPDNIYNRVNFATVAFNVEHTTLLHPWDCTPVSWNVEGIENVFFDGRPAVGQERVTYCPRTASYPAPRLYVDFQGNFIQEYTIPVRVLTATPSFWIGVVLLIILGGLAADWPLTRPGPLEAGGISRRAVLAGLGAGGLLAGFGAWGWARNSEPAADPTTTVTEDGWVVRTAEARN